jgi:8-oxo-dGTP pyrophosphatase MutT (NUDIX family)
MGLDPNSIVSKKVLDFDQIKIQHIKSSLDLNVEMYKAVQTNWQELVTEAAHKNVKMWDSLCYRFEGFNSANNSLKLSKLNYSIIRGLEKLRYTNQPYIPASQCLFVTSLIETRQGQFVLGKKHYIESHKDPRSKTTLIGGVCSPDELIINTGKDIEYVLLKEIEEELGIKPAHIVSNKVIGITYGKHTNVGIICTTKLDLDKDQILQSFSSYSDKEIDSLQFVDYNQMLEILHNHPSYPSLIPELLT